MTAPQTALRKIDHWQQRHRWPAVTYAILKKYGEDGIGQQAALLTYYAFLSLFPLLLVLTTLTSLLAGHYPGVQREVIRATTDYFPVLGGQLSEHIQTLHKNGLALVIGLVLILYGARGVADAFRRGVQTVWHVPQSERITFPRTVSHSLMLVTVGGLGLVAASICTGLAATAGHGLLFRLLSVAINLFILFWLFAFLLTACLPRHVALKDIRSGALSMAVGLIVLQALGGYLLKVELSHLDALYSYFALALGLLFWIYLQAQLLYYAVTLAAVRSQHLWPRSFNEKKDSSL
jgi:YihY family inner membrane protein